MVNEKGKTFAIVGTRSFADFEMMEAVLKMYKIAVIVSGGAKGADALAKKYAEENNILYREFLPNWEKYGRAAGPIRNKEIVDNADMVIAFWVGLDLNKAKIRRIDRATAEKIILEYEWLGKMNQGSNAHYGIFFNNIYCGGVVCIGGMGGTIGSPSFHKQFGVKQEEVAILVRGACPFWSPKGTGSKLISWVIKLYQKDFPIKKLIVAFSDPLAGEIGTIYQATNWWYAGMTSKSFEWRLGKIRRHARWVGLQVEKYGGIITSKQVIKALKKMGWVEKELPPKHKYLYILDKSILPKLEGKLSKDYPKR